MIQIELHRSFIKAFDKRIKSNNKLSIQANNRIETFKVNRNHQLLRDHSLTGSKNGYRSFSINGDIRVVYYLKSEDVAVFTDIGSHNQVY